MSVANNQLEKVSTRTLLKQYRQLSELCRLLDHGNLWSNINHVRLAIDRELMSRDLIGREVKKI